MNHVHKILRKIQGNRSFLKHTGYSSALTLVITAVQTIISPQQKGRLFPTAGSFHLVCNLFLHWALQLFINCKWELRIGRALCSSNDSVRRAILKLNWDGLYKALFWWLECYWYFENWNLPDKTQLRVIYLFLNEKINQVLLESRFLSKAKLSKVFCPLILAI